MWKNTQLKGPPPFKKMNELIRTAVNPEGTGGGAVPLLRVKGWQCPRAWGGFIPFGLLEEARGEAGLGARLTLYDKGNGIERG